MKLKRFVAVALTLCLLLSAIGPGAAHAVTWGGRENMLFNKINGDLFDLDLKKDPISSDLALEQIDDDQIVKVIIIMESESVVEADASAVLNDKTQAQMEKLEREQDLVVSRIERTVLDGAALDVSYSYTWLLNGVAAAVPYGTVSAIEKLSGVKQVLLQPQYEVCETAEPLTVSDGVMIGRDPVWASGYTGEGIKIAVVDTGLDIDHQNFAALPEDKLTADSADADTVAAVLDQLNASSRFPGLTTEDVYYNSKVVYGFNYCDDNLNITHDFDAMGDHGTHVAGIAAANKVEGSEVVGVAPDAQLYIMKVFGEGGGAYAEDILAGLEDALILGADVVNMSLGTTCGFTSSTDEVNAIYNRVAQTNTVLTVSAGNSFTAGYGNTWGTDLNLTANPDNAVIGAPAVYSNVMSVASVENWKIQRNYIAAGDYKMGYIDTGVSYDLPNVMTLTGEYGLVAVPGYGAAEDFEGLDLTGKVALVQRGVESFVAKVENAEAAGAVACIVYNNTTGEEFGMDLTDNNATIPAVSITLADGEYLVSALEKDPGLTLTFPEDLTGIPSVYAYQMSDFSSWGVAPDLSLEPDITAPGGNIYSTVNNGGYDVMSGTSMAAPNLAGITALVMQYVRDNYDVADGDYRTLVQNLLMSTSAPLVYDEENGLYYSPRQQGSGLANAFNTVNTWVYLTVDGCDTPKAELGDDPGKTGTYSYVFKVTNFGTSDAYYALSTVAQTEDWVEFEGYEGLYFMSGTPLALNAATSESSANLVLTYDVDGNGVTDSHDAYLIYQAATGNAADEGWTDTAFRYDVDGSESTTTDDVQAYLNALVGLDSEADLEEQALCVGAGETAEVTVDLTLSEEDHDYFETYFENGGYVEGFTFLDALSEGGVDLSLPYLGYYGSWDAPDVLDDGFYWELLNAEEGTVVGNQYVNVLWTEFYGMESSFYPGMNAYVEEPIDLSHISISPNGDGYIDTIDDIYVSLLRNARTLTFRYVNAETGEVYYDQTAEYVSKSAYSTAYGEIIPTIYSWLSDEIALYDFKDTHGNDLPNNTKLLLQVEATGAYEGATSEMWEIPVTVDLEAPELLSVVKVTDPETGKVTLELTFKDNLSVAAVGLLNSNGTDTYYLEGVTDTEPDENGYRNYTVSYDITDITGKLMLVLADYALNETYYAMNTGGEGASYGELIAYQYNLDADVNGWVAFGEGVDGDEVQITMDDRNIVAAEYVNGFVFAQDENGALYGFRYEDMLADSFDIETTYIAQLENTYQDFAYSYADGQLYGLLTYEDAWGVSSDIYSININGEYYDEDLWTDVAPYEEVWRYGRGGLFGLGLAVDDAGTIYILGTVTESEYDDESQSWVDVEKTQLWASYESRYGTLFQSIMDIDVSMDYLQSMTWDHNTGKLYWAQFYPVGIFTYETNLYAIEPDAGTIENVGTLSGETCALFAPLTEETIASNEIYQNVPVMDTSAVARPILREDVLNMNIGNRLTLAYDLDPWYTDHRDVIWSSSDESIVSVDENGTVTAVSEGTAVITVTAKDDETLSDSCTVNVTALSLIIEGIVSAQSAGLGNVTGVSTYKFEMTDGVPSFGTVNRITASEDLNFGLSLATSVMGRGSIWACEYGNTGMIYEIDPETGAVKDVLEPMGGDMLFGMTYNEELDTFAAIMNMYLFADLELTHEEEDKVLASYDEEQHAFMYHRINMLPYLIESNTGFVTGEDGQGASSEIVMCGITTLPGGYVHEDTWKDYMGNWAYGGSVNYVADQTLVVLDNVGRLWYIDEIVGMTRTGDENNGYTYTSENGSEIYRYGEHRNGMFELEIVDAEGNVTYSVFNIRSIEETPLTDMFRQGTMPRITYHFSDIEFGGYTEAGAPIFALSLYDYWNNGTTNELYLYIPAVTEFDEDLYEDVVVSPAKFYTLGNTGEYNIIASIHHFEVTGGLPSDD